MTVKIKCEVAQVNPVESEDEDSDYEYLSPVEISTHEKDEDLVVIEIDGCEATVRLRDLRDAVTACER